MLGGSRLLRNETGRSGGSGLERSSTRSGEAIWPNKNNLNAPLVYGILSVGQKISLFV